MVGQVSTIYVFVRLLISICISSYQLVASVNNVRPDARISSFDALNVCLVG